TRFSRDWSSDVCSSDLDQPDSSASAARVETGLPALTQGDRTEQRSLTEWMEALAVPGVSIAVIDDNRIVWAKAYGVTTPGPLGRTEERRVGKKYGQSGA